MYNFTCALYRYNWAMNIFKRLSWTGIQQLFISRTPVKTIFHSSFIVVIVVALETSKTAVLYSQVESLTFLWHPPNDSIPPTFINNYPFKISHHLSYTCTCINVHVCICFISPYFTVCVQYCLCIAWNNLLYTRCISAWTHNILLTSWRILQY